MYTDLNKQTSRIWKSLWEIGIDCVIPGKWAILAVANFVLLKQIFFFLRYIIICIYTIFTFKVDKNHSEYILEMCQYSVSYVRDSNMTLLKKKWTNILTSYYLI